MPTKKAPAVLTAGALLWGLLPWPALAQTQLGTAGAGAAAGSAGAAGGTPISLTLPLESALPGAGLPGFTGLGLDLPGSALPFVQPDLRPGLEGPAALPGTTGGPVAAGSLAPGSFSALPETGAGLGRLLGEGDRDGVSVGRRLDAFYDRRGALPESGADAVVPADGTVSAAEIIGRAGRLGIGRAGIGESIQGSKDLPHALRRLEEIGLLQPGEMSLDVREDGAPKFRWILSQLWYEAAPHTPRSFELDRSWPVPAHVVRKGDVTYYVHSLFPHPSKVSLVPPQLGPVRRLVMTLQGLGLSLYSEQNLPLAYGYSYGKEIVDRDPATNEELPVAGVRPVPARPSLVLSTPLKAAWTALTLGLPALWAASSPESFWAWPALAGSALYNYLLWTAFVPLRRLADQWTAWTLSRGGSMDAALFLSRKARAFFTNRPDPDEIRRATLPLPERAYRSTPYGRRAEAIAAIAQEDAGVSGLKEVHILTGVNHSEEAAWALAR